MTIVVVVSAWLVLTGIGWLALAPLDRRRRNALLPAAPLFGVVMLVVVLHDTTLLVSVSVGIWCVAAVLVLLGVVATKRDPSWWRPSRTALASLLLGAMCGILPAIWVLGPSLAAGDSEVIQPSSNNDAFYYVTVVDWLQDHPATDVPNIRANPDEGGDPPSWNSAKAQLTLNLRIGQELTQAALTTVLGSDVDRTWYPLTALWVLLVPASGIGAARLLRLRLVTGVLLGLFVSVSALVLFQVAAQNSDSLLGTALLPLAVSAVLQGVLVPDTQRRLLPLAYVGVVLTALIGTYTELAPLIAPGLAAAVILRPRREIPGALGAALAIFAVAVASAPLAWLRAVRSLLFLGGIPADSFPSVFDGVPLAVVLSRFLGITGPSATAISSLLLVLMLAWVLVGIVSAIWLDRGRWALTLFVAIGVFLAVYLVTVRHRPYTQQRVVELLLPLVALVIAVGWDRLLSRAQSSRDADTGGKGAHAARPDRAWRPGTLVAGIGVLGALVLLVANTATDQQMDLTAQAKARHVDVDFAEAAGWIRAVGGSRSSVLVGDFFSQLWITDALRNEPEVSYPSLFLSYQGQVSYWNGQPRRWLLVDRNAIVSASPDAIVRRNNRFELLDLARGKAVVAVPADVFGQNSFVVLRSAQGPERVRLQGSARARTSTDAPPAPGYGESLSPHVLVSSTTRITISMRSTLARRLVLSDADAIFTLQRLVGIGRAHLADQGADTRAARAKTN